MRSVQEGDCPRRVPAPGLSRRHHITRPHSQNTRVLPQPAPGPDAPEARVSGTRAYPREAHAARPRSRSGPGGLRRGAVPALGSPGLSLPPRCPPPGPGRPAAPVSSPAAAGRAAPGRTRRGSALAPPSPATRPPTWRSQAPGPGFRNAGVVRVIGALRLRRAPSRTQPLSRGRLARDALESLAQGEPGRRPGGPRGGGPERCCG